MVETLGGRAGAGRQSDDKAVGKRAGTGTDLQNPAKQEEKQKKKGRNQSFALLRDSRGAFRGEICMSYQSTITKLPVGIIPHFN